MPGVIRAYVRFTDRITTWVGYLAASLIFVMAAVLMFDAFTRNAINYPFSWPFELTQFMLAAYFFMGGAWTMKTNEHVRMDLWYANLSQRGKAWADLVTSFFLIFYLGVLLWGGISSLTYAIQTGERRFSMWNPSVIPIKAIMVGCVVLMLMQAFALVFRNIATLRGEDLE